jgi:hypothetical protein
MLKEYALQPELLSSWPVFRLLSDKFGYGRGRVISRYPRRWKRLVYESLVDCKVIEKKRIEEGLIRLETALYPRYHEWNKEMPWLPNAIEENGKRPFEAIISSHNPDANTSVICEDELDEEKEPRWQAETQRRIERTATEMASCAKLFLQNAKDIIFVDPHFNPQVQRFKRPLNAFLQIVSNRPTNIPINRIEIHTGHTSNGTKDYFDAECIKHLPFVVPNGLKVRIVRWDQNYLHNRFILTEYGGLKYASGLDDHDGRASKHDIVDLLEVIPYNETWGEYQRESSGIPLIEDDLIIEGRA